MGSPSPRDGAHGGHHKLGTRLAIPRSSTLGGASRGVVVICTQPSSRNASRQRAAVQGCPSAFQPFPSRPQAAVQG